MPGRTIAIGDIHGGLAALDAILPRPEDTFHPERLHQPWPVHPVVCSTDSSTWAAADPETERGLASILQAAYRFLHCLGSTRGSCHLWSSGVVSGVPLT
jgi:hypothetical protein